MGRSRGLIGGPTSLCFLIIFTAIGISFLLPLEISFSAWFYFLVGKAVILTHVWMGYGRNGNDYPTDWLWINNPVTAQGGGGLVLFSAVSLYRCLKDYARLVVGRSLADRVRIGLPVLGLALSMLVVTLWVSWNRVGFVWALLFVVVLTLLTIGLMRIVAEGGIYWFQSHVSFFHIYKMLGLGKFLAPSLLGPLIPIYSILFLDTKTFMAPNILNSASMHKNVGGSRAKFHLSILLSILVSLVVSLGFAVFLAHLRGAQQEHSWFYSAGPQSVIDTARDASKAVAGFNGVTTFWWIFGACWVALSLYLRTWLFWFPHPIGFIMLINPLMGQLWFSFFIGWICKKFVVRYGGKATFEKIRDFFMGLIMGELDGDHPGHDDLDARPRGASLSAASPSIGISGSPASWARTKAWRPLAGRGCSWSCPEPFRLIRTEGTCWRAAGRWFWPTPTARGFRFRGQPLADAGSMPSGSSARKLTKAARKSRRKPESFVSLKHDCFQQLLMDSDNDAGLDRCVGYCEATSRVVEWVFHGEAEAKRNPANLTEPILAATYDQPLAQPTRWAFFDVSFIAPAGLRIPRRCAQPRGHARQPRGSIQHARRPVAVDPPRLSRITRTRPPTARCVAPRLVRRFPKDISPRRNKLCKHPLHPWPTRDR